MSEVRLIAARELHRVQLRVASWILGAGWFGVIMRLWLVRDRAMAAIRPDGRVILAECQALADALYAPIPGRWTICVTREDEPVAPSPAPGAGT